MLGSVPSPADDEVSRQQHTAARKGSLCDLHPQILRGGAPAGIQLYRKGPGQPAKLAYLGHILMENRHALVVGTRLTLATGTAEREAALEMVADRPGNHRITLGADKAYDVAQFVADLRAHHVTPHV